jgi:hypothetical protein
VIIHHVRDLYDEDWTLGELCIQYDALAYGKGGWTSNARGDELLPFGFIAEDCDRGLAQSQPLADIEAAKVKGRTAIPVGEYRVAFTFSNRFGRPMPLLFDVPGFRGIRIHSGNTAADTEGCVCPALARDPAAGRTSQSKPAVEWLHARIRECQDRGEVVRWRIARDAAAWVAFRGGA